MTTLNWTATDDLELRQEANEAWEMEHALAEYHMSQDMSAMAARIDSLLEENATLQQLLNNHKSWLQMASEQRDKAQDMLDSFNIVG
jgi:regulator of replication initiation timing